MKSLSTAYMARKFARGGRVPKKESPQMCEHGGPIEECMAHGGDVKPVEATEELPNEEILNEEMPLEEDEMSMEPEMDLPSEEEEPVKMSQGGMMKTRILGKILGGAFKR